jgi:hypothetical protein
MVNFSDKSFTDLKRADKIRVIDDCKKKADEKISDIDFFIDLITNYKLKLDSEKAKL